MDWIIPANGKKYNHAAAFQKWGFIDWWQKGYNYEIGDNIYIYCTNPIQKIMFKACVEKINLTADEIVDDSEFWLEQKENTNGLYVRLRLVEQADREELNYKHLKGNGLKGPPQGSIKLSEEKEKLKNYIEKYMNDNNYHFSIFPDSSDTGNCVEGAKTTIEVNKYERSYVARQKCIDENGCYCHICGLDFEKRYGKVGKNFIHVHHKIPLNEIKEEYIIDPINDLIPVCPNCHAMLHRKVDDRYLSINELKNIF